jgi:sugar lactone lactonase YvrE
MAQLPVNSIVGFLGVLLLLFGFFLALAGSQILRIEKVSVAPGPRTWGFGLVLLVIGLSLVIVDAGNLILPSLPVSEESITSGKSEPTTIPPTVAAADVEPTPLAIPTSEIAPTQTSPDIGEPQPSPDAPLGIEVPSGYKVEHILRPAIIGPTDVAIGPDGVLYISEWLTHRVVRVGLDGMVSTFAESEALKPSLTSDANGNLFVPDGESILKISPDGERSVYADDIDACSMDFDPSGDLFMLTRNQLIKLTPAGDRIEVSDEIPGCGDLAVSPSGEAFITNVPDGAIYKVNSNGEATILVDGFVTNAFNIDIDNEGNLYSNQESFQRVSLADGSLSSPLLPNLNVAINWRPFAFYPSGEAVFINPSNNTVVKVSLDGQSKSCLVEGLGNSYGLAVSPAGELFIGASNCHPISPGRIFKVRPDGAMEEYASGFALIHDIIFDPSGNMYVADYDYGEDGGGRLLKVSQDGTINVLPTGANDLLSIAYLPESGDILGFESNSKGFLRVSPNQEIKAATFDFGADVYTVYLSSDQQGNLIALVNFEEGISAGLVHRGLYRITSEGKISPLTNLDTPAVGSEDAVFVAPSGDIFIAGVADVDAASRILRVTPDGEVSVFSQNVPFSTQSIVVNPEGDIFITCSAGLFRIYTGQ